MNQRDVTNGQSKAGNLKELSSLLESVSIDENSSQSRVIQLSIALARHLQRRANQLQTPEERRQQAELDRMIQSPSDKVTMIQMTDQAFRAKTPNRAVDQLVHILDVQGIPRFFTPFDRALLKGFQSFGSYLPGVAVPMVKEKMQQETSNVVLPAEKELLAEHLRARRTAGVRMNVNFLGEALLGEDDAKARLQKYLQAMQNPDIEVISVKISTIYSQISSLAFEHTLDILCDRLELLYRASAKSTFTRGDGSTVPKFVYLDMEEYRDMRLTAETFKRTLSRPGLENVHAGIVLQAYIPDSFEIQKQLVKWAQQRVADGGAPITMRIVKGANMEMERFESCQYGWPQAPYRFKTETDANYRRMVAWGLQPDNIAAARLGIASHNLFEVAYGIVKAFEQNALDKVQFEMLEGMANHQRRALQELVEDLLLYAPACRKEEFIHAIGYLVRRLDENTGPSNFLRHAFRLKVDSEDWERLEEQFCKAFNELDTLSESPRRIQDRNDPIAPVQPPTEDEHWQNFVNESDTDFALPQNVNWSEKIIADWRDRHSDKATEVPLEVAGKPVTGKRPQRQSTDPSRPDIVVATYQQANADDVDAAIACAKDDNDGWRSKSFSERQAVLSKVANKIRERRGDLMGAALAEGGKTLLQSDPEVSEAVDFVEFYTRTAQYVEQLSGVTAQGRGVVVVVSPWNFPIAIPCGGVAAALAAGNTVILKPASDTVLVAYEMCKCFWEAGVSKKTLQLLPCSGATQGQQLAAHQDVDTVILTGGTETAFSMLNGRVDMRLLAETGGKNATIVTAMADRDQAIKNVIYSAFGHAGQKCSATSLLILEGEVFEDEKFKQTLCDAVKSMKVGSAWDLATKIGPLIRPPSGELEVALKELEQGESWAVMPQCAPANRQLYSPAVKWGVRPDSFTHCTEFFGPVLAVMRADNLRHAIELVNQSGYGLTSGLESLDSREQEIWKDEIRAGNLYINRGTTGAVVLRQPFGGMGKSAFGPGIKAGGPNYVAQLMKFEDNFSPEGPEESDVAGQGKLVDEQLLALKKRFSDSSEDWSTDEVLNQLDIALRSFAFQFATEFGRQHDHMRLIGQDNFRRYLPVRELRIRVHESDTAFEILARVAAARSVGCRVTVSLLPAMDSGSVAAKLLRWLDHATESWAADIEFVEESDLELAVAIENGRARRVRYAAPDRVPNVIRQSASLHDCYVADEPVLTEGRIELLWYLEEQSISDNYHRYGNLGDRINEERAAVG